MACHSQDPPRQCQRAAACRAERAPLPRFATRHILLALPSHATPLERPDARRRTRRPMSAMRGRLSCGTATTMVKALSRARARPSSPSPGIAASGRDPRGSVFGAAHAGGVIEQNVIAGLRFALRHAMGLPQAVREMTKPQAAIVRLSCEEVGIGRLQEMLSRRMGPLLAEEVFPPQVEVITSSLRDVAPSALASMSLKVQRHANIQAFWRWQLAQSAKSRHSPGLGFSIR